MCRYMFEPYKNHWVCVPCRITFKLPYEDRDPRPDPWPACQKCGARMVDLGKDFHTPRRANRRQWRKVELLIADGIRFDSCGCSGPGPRPRTLSDAKSQLGHRRSRHQTGTRRAVPA